MTGFWVGPAIRSDQARGALTQQFNVLGTASLDSEEGARCFLRARALGLAPTSAS
jgi:hypothetical protein